MMELVREALLGAPPPSWLVASLQALDDEGWRSLLEEARRQTVTGLFFTSLDRLPAEVEVPADISMALMAEVDGILRKNALVREVESTVLSLFSSAGLATVIMKGSACAARYPDPGYREQGDIDLYVQADGIQSVRDLLSAAGYPVADSPDDSLLCNVKGVDIDIHRVYYDFCRHTDSLPEVPSPEAELVMLAAHILKHAAGPGVGLRQICDFALADRMFQGDRQALGEAFRTAGLERWVRHLRAFVCDYLGENPSSTTNDSSRLLDIVASGGNFGHYGHGRQDSLGQSSIKRKADTLVRMISRLPFAMRYAPAMTLKRFASLSFNNIGR